MTMFICFFSVSFNSSNLEACWDPEPHTSNQNMFPNLDPPKTGKIKLIAWNMEKTEKGNGGSAWGQTHTLGMS